MGSEVLPVVKNTPLLAGVCGTDPYRMMPQFLKQVKEMGFSGVQNYPTVAYFEGVARKYMEDTGFSYDLEVYMIREARQLDLFTAPYVYNITEAEKMTHAGADM
jgi:predicted TIM-barrel enzyme